MTSLKVEDFIKNTVSLLKRNGISHEESVCETYILLEYFSGISKKDFIVNPNIEIDNGCYQKLEKAIIERIEQKLPVQYITGEAFFMGEIFSVDKNVLIPRDETELLVNSVIKVCERIENPLVVDIGTGSGCISIILAKILKSAKIISCDISEKAIELAKKNALTLGLEEKITFLKSDLLENIDLPIDVIVSNPPYIDIKELETMQKEVALHEPHLALFAEERGTIIYRKIIEQASQKLKSDGYVLFELGLGQSEKIKELFLINNFSVRAIINDFAGIERVIIAKKI